MLMKNKKLFVLSNPDLLVAVKRGAKALFIMDIQIYLNNEGLFIRQIDQSGAAMLIIKCPSTSFQEFWIDKDEEHILIVPSGKFSKAVERIEKMKGPIVVTLGDAELIIKSEGVKSKSFTIELFADDEDDVKKEPEIGHPTKVILDSKEFFGQVKDLDGFSENVFLQMKDGYFNVYGDKKEVFIQTLLADNEMYEVVLDGETTARYSLSFLSEIVKLFKEYEKITVEFTDNKPLILTTIIGEITAKTILAPVVEQLH